MNYFVITDTNENDRCIAGGEALRPNEVGENEGLRWALLPRALRSEIDRWDWDAEEIVVDFNKIEQHLLADIDRHRSAELNKFLAPTREIQELHRLKAEEATNNLSSTPMIDAEAAALNVPRSVVVESVRLKSEEQIAAFARIESRARAAKEAVRAATGNEEAMRAAAQIDWSAE